MTRTNTPHRARWLACGLAAALLLPAADADAQDYPNQPVRIVVGFSAGGSIDTVTRLIAPALQDILGQPVIVENRPGAQGRTGAHHVVHSDPDGYTLLATTETSILIARHIGEPLPYDSLEDLRPVTNMAEYGNIIVAHHSFEFDNFEDLVAAAREHPDRYMYGHSGVGGSLHLAMELTKLRGDISISGVSYGTGGGAILPAVLNNEVPMIVSGVGVALPHIEEGTLKALVATSPTRSPLLPDVPTVEEAGIENAGISSFIGLYAPAGTPDEILETIADAVAEALENEEVRAQLDALAFTPVGNRPAEFEAFVRATEPVYKELSEALGPDLQ